MGLDTKTYWLTDRQSQCDFDFDLSYSCAKLGRGQFGNPEKGERPSLQPATRQRLVKTKKTLYLL
jgi:hypothetical protein